MTLDQEYLKSILHYNARSGEFVWLTNSGPRIQWVRAGSITRKGYRSIRIESRNFFEHRLAWLYVHGKWPTNEIDHINGDRADNRFSNLREVTRSQNLMNSGMRSDNTSGYRGVSYYNATKKYHATIKINGKLIHLGRFHRPEQAAAIATLARIEHFGKYSRDRENGFAIIDEGPISDPLPPPVARRTKEGVITHERLLQLLDYDRDTGAFSWRHGGGGKARGQVTGRRSVDNHVSLRVDGKRYSAHRLAWFYVHGRWPTVLDHKNRRKSDNRISNLREATISQNSANVGPRPNTATGMRGVNFYKRKGLFQAYVRRNGKMKHLGYFKTAEEAAAVALEARIAEYGEFTVDASGAPISLIQT